MHGLLNYRRQNHELYRSIRHSDDPLIAWQHFRETRDNLFRTHAQSPLDTEAKAVFSHLSYYDYDPDYRVMARIETNVNKFDLEYDLGDDGNFQCSRFGEVHFTLPSGSASLSLFWINGYGGGLFLPFGDSTSRTTTYGGGRYLYDTIKGADLGSVNDELILDFNFAYNPSCAYSPRWTCPLAPQENRLSIPVLAGEQIPHLPS